MVEKDEREETGLRAVLNYGHTFAHAFETVGGYGAWLHGEAVAAGMMLRREARREARSHRRGASASGKFAAEANSVCRLRPQAEWPTDDLIAVMRRDKKAAAGRMRFILPTRIGEVELFDDVPESLVRDVLEGR